MVYPIIVPLFTMLHDSLPIVGALLHPSPLSGVADGFGYAVS